MVRRSGIRLCVLEELLLQLLGCLYTAELYIDVVVTTHSSACDECAAWLLALNGQVSMIGYFSHCASFD
jgi:hypothetical protein